MYKECKTCQKIVEQEVIYSTGHNIGDWIIDKEATCMEHGLKHKECIVCHGIFEQKIIYSTEHDISGWIIDKEATCIEEGLRHRECTTCHKTFDREEIDSNIEYNFMNGACPKCGKLYHCDGTYVYFGFYPQTIKDKTVTIIEDTSEQEYYLGSDGNYYVRVEKGSLYYFKVEPIKWRILEDRNGNYQLLSEYILECQNWDNSSNNYKESSIRRWLNSTFYNHTFTEELQQIIQATLVDNSVESEIIKRNMYVKIQMIISTY